MAMTPKKQGGMTGKPKPPKPTKPASKTKLIGPKSTRRIIPSDNYTPKPAPRQKGIQVNNYGNN